MSEQSRPLEAIINAVPHGVVVLDGDLRIQVANSAALNHLAHLSNARAGEVLARLGEQPVTELLRYPVGQRVEVQARQHAFEVMVSPAALDWPGDHWVLVIDDVTHGREMQQRAQAQDRMAAIGQLAAGMAHDFNNLLAVIVLHTQVGLLQPANSPLLRECLDVILRQAVRAGDLVKQVLEYGRPTFLEPRPLRLGPFIAEQVHLLRRTLPDNIRVQFEEDTGDYTVNADPTRLQQVVVNLALNARDAMSGGGSLSVLLDGITVAERGDAPLPDMRPGAWVRIRITDTGQGIPPAVLPRIFEPFFTTKGPHGTGLGLAQVYGIIKQHGGEIQVASAPGAGSTFAFYLPASREAEPEPQPHANDVLALGKGETVLVVEDDKAVRTALSMSLEQLDYHPLEARNGREALALLMRPSQDIALVLSDMVMPEMGGLALLEALKEHHIATPLVFLSGHPIDHDPTMPDQDQYAGWLQKPVNLEGLAALLARVLQH